MPGWPSTLTSFTNPASTDKLNSPSHSAIETAQNTALVELQTFIGTQASAVGTLFYDVRSANSDGGGHVQTANKGGTGQTSYNKGDLLVASSSSVLTKMAVGLDGQVPVANSSVTTGIEWQGVATGRQIQNMEFQYAQDGGSGSVYAIYPVPCVLSYSAGQMFLMKAANANTVANPALSVSSLVAKTIKNINGSVLSIGQIRSSSLNLMGYDGAASVFQLLNPAPADIRNARSIPNQTSIFSNMRAYSAASVSTGLTAYTKLKEISITQPGDYDVGFTMRTTTGTGTANGRVYKNASAIGAEQSESAQNYTDFSNPVTGLVVGDLIQIYGKQTIGGANTVAIKDVRLIGSPEDAGSWTLE